MKKKIFLYLLMLFLFFAAGAIFSTLYIKNTTIELSRLINLHQIEDLRQNLVMSIQTVQSDLYTVRTSLGSKLDSIVKNVAELDKNAEHCTSCHHEPEVAKELNEMQMLIHEYQDALSQYITVSANSDRVDNLKLNAAAIGNKALMNTGEMSLKASEKLGLMTNSAMAKINKAKAIIYITVLLTFIFGAFIALRLAMSITHPINELTRAATAIEMGEVGYTISYEDSTEFGKLAAVFNKMSVALESGYSNLHKEIIERKQAEEALRESQERYALSARGANDGLWDWDLISNQIYFSDRWRSMLGYDKSDIGESPEEWISLVHADDRKQLEAKIAAHIKGHSSYLESEYRILHRDRTYRWVLNRGLAVRDNNGKAYRMAGSQTDITERKVAEEQLLHDAFHDALSGLPNRALFMDRLHHRLQQLIKGKQRHRQFTFAVLFLDLDRFKIINDSLGHMIGDQLLIEVSQRLSRSVRPGDTVARLGGDEFAIILEDIQDREHAEQITERLQKELPLPFYISGNEVFTSASIGIAISSMEYEKPEDMIRDADIAMYQAKAKGKANYEVFDPSMYAGTVARLHLETDLRRAVEHNEFVIHYQPIIELSTEKIIGFEALVRWNHPKRGLIYPMEFIPLAEETGLIFPIGEWVLHEACRQLNEWQKQYPLNSTLKMSVNISSKQFLQPDLPEKVDQILQKNCIDACCLSIEITESMIMENVESAIEMLNKLKAMGVHIHIDDFGTGYSSLSYINRFPVNALKIDRSFIEKMLSNDENLEIVKTIVMLAHNLKLDLIAEGLERPDQLNQLMDLKCHYGQGFLLSKPMDAKNVETWIESKLPTMKSKQP